MDRTVDRRGELDDAATKVGNSAIAALTARILLTIWTLSFLINIGELLYLGQSERQALQFL